MKKAPDTFVIIFSIIVLAALLTRVIPGGKYEKVAVDGKEWVDPASFHHVESQPQGVGAILTAPIRGVVDAALIIGFVLIVGGAFGIFQKSGAVDAGIAHLVRLHDHSDFLKWATIPLFMILFSLAGAVFGMSEELIPFVLIFIPLAIRLGYDSIAGVAVPFVGAGAGFAGAFLNPFTVGIAQGMAEIPLFSGIGYRLIVWTITTTIAILYVMRYAQKVKVSPQLSVCFDMDEVKREEHAQDDLHSEQGLDMQHRLTLILFALGMLVLVFGVLEFGWYIEEIAALFFALGIFIALVGRLSISEMTGSFVDGAKDLVSTALLIGFARGILLISQDGQIIDTMLFALSQWVGKFHPILASAWMFLVQTFINFFIPSGSGQAALTMPIMAPLADLVGVSRQTAVLAFQFGDGFSNLIIPTSAVTMGVLTIAKISWTQWARWIYPLMLIFMLTSVLLLIPPYFIQW
ncbi:MAG TPA: putative basic amino acid antiporter YfcC [Candidatus Marinimicrobia bacterium]|nr:putative basic amino acid antiporter YfcC [Candidatus Neomarinimicrobiota bacterium]